MNAWVLKRFGLAAAKEHEKRQRIAAACPDKKIAAVSSICQICHLRGRCKK